MHFAFKHLILLLLVSNCCTETCSAAYDGVPCLTADTPVAFRGGWEGVGQLTSLGHAWGAPYVAPDASVKKPTVVLAGWGAPYVAPDASAKKPAAVPMGAWGAAYVAPVDAAKGDYVKATHDVYAKATHDIFDKAAEAKYTKATHGVFAKASHEAVDSTDYAALQREANKLEIVRIELTGALAFAEILKLGHEHLSGYLATAGKSLAGSLAAGEATPWAADAVTNLLTPMVGASLVEMLADGATAVSTLSDAQVFAALDDATNAEHGAVIAALAADAARKNAATGDTSGTDALEAVKTQLAIRTFLKHVG